MGQRELLLVLGAVILFGVALIAANTGMVSQNEDSFKREFEHYALSLAKSYIEEARAKPFFDEALNGGTPAVPDSFTAVADLGPDGENYPNYDDVDDFNGLSRIDTARSDYSVTIQVGYVDEPNWETFVTFKTRFKTMKVSVTENHYLNATVQLNEVFAYVE
ncbi:MAG: hypothetical protein ACE5G1_08450 [bacterium]